VISKNIKNWYILMLIIIEKCKKKKKVKKVKKNTFPDTHYSIMSKHLPNVAYKGTYGKHGAKVYYKIYLAHNLVGENINYFKRLKTL
jgi:hypothetical protein